MSKKVKITGAIASKLVTQLSGIGINLDWNPAKGLIISVEETAPLHNSFTVWEKISIWRKYGVQTIESQESFIESLRKKGIDYIAECDSELNFETEESLEPKDQDGYATLEIRNQDTGEIIWQNGQ